MTKSGRDSADSALRFCCTIGGHAGFWLIGRLRGFTKKAWEDHASSSLMLILALQL
jgi:hypothetical protein